MADDKTKAAKDAGFVGRSSSEQAEENAKIASKPQGGVPNEGDANPALTAHTTKPGVVRDSEGNVVAVHTTEVIVDPESPLAVQVPDPEVWPNATGGSNPLEAQASEGEAEPFSEVGESDDEAVQSGTQGSEPKSKRK
jgi:hypothetical protein